MLFLQNQFISIIDELSSLDEIEIDDEKKKINMITYINNKSIFKSIVYKYFPILNLNLYKQIYIIIKSIIIDTNPWDYKNCKNNLLMMFNYKFPIICLFNELNIICS